MASSFSKDDDVINPAVNEDGKTASGESEHEIVDTEVVDNVKEDILKKN
jgi:hypothetical protein